MKLQYVVALVMTAAWMSGIARAADAPADTPAEAPVPAVTMTDAQKAVLRKTLETCGTCHGINGRSVAPTFPNLAGQSAPYIELQLHAFKDQSRADPDAQAYMWGMASQLNDAVISGLASYFASQPAAVGTPGNPALIAQGKSEDDVVSAHPTAAYDAKFKADAMAAERFIRPMYEMLKK